MLSQAVDGAVEKQVPFDVQFRVGPPGGEPRWITATGRVERNTKNQPVRMLGVCLDITERRRSELETQELRENLAHSSRVATMGGLASALAHELSQPLGAILRNTEAAELLMAQDPPDLAEIRAILADIRKDDQRAGEVIHRLRSLLRRQPSERVPLSINDLLNEAAELTRGDALRRRVRVELDASPNLPQVRGDLVLLEQVLINLLINGMEAMKDLPTENRRLQAQARLTHERKIEVAVADSGPGFPAGDSSRIFEPFFTTKPQGMGLGLAISRSIIEAHGGKLSAENRAEGGARFVFVLPIIAEGESK
jgi:C4-dicarboxylate-specific signal transduction histidine kinase